MIPHCLERYKLVTVYSFTHSISAVSGKKVYDISNISLTNFNIFS